jgi:hypothetical protein
VVDVPETAAVAAPEVVAVVAEEKAQEIEQVQQEDKGTADLFAAETPVVTAPEAPALPFDDDQGSLN